MYTEFPLKALLRKADFSGRISTWSVELSQYNIDYQPRTAIKGQVLADFVAEFTPSEAESPTVREYEPGPRGDNQNTGSWHLFVDGSACNKGSGAGIVLFAPEHLMLEQSVRLGFSATNNVAEYEALLIGLKSARTLGAKKLKVFCDSQLVVN